MDVVLLVVVVLGVLGGLYFYLTRGDDTYKDMVMVDKPTYDDPLLEERFGSVVTDAAHNEQDKTDTRDQQTENTDNYAHQHIYDSHGNLIFGHQDETEDLDRPEVDDLA